VRPLQGTRGMTPLRPLLLVPAFALMACANLPSLPSVPNASVPNPLGSSPPPAIAAVTGDPSKPTPQQISIKRTHRTLMSGGFTLEASPMDPKKRVKREAELRQAVVHNVAARIANGKGQRTTAMWLTLESRRMARAMMDIVGETDNLGHHADADETQLAAGGAGADADAAVAEADKKVPQGDAFKKLIPDGIDPED